MVKKQCSVMALRYMLITHDLIIYLDPRVGELDPSFRRYAPACVLRQIKVIKTNKNAGTNPVDEYTIVADDYYDAVDKSQLNIYAIVKPYEIPANIPNFEKNYDGKVEAEFTGWGTTIFEPDRGKLKLTVVADGKDEGIHGCVGKGTFYLGGSITNNYTIDETKIKIKINKRPLSFIENPTAVYDGSNKKVVAGSKLIKGLVDGESLTITIDTGYVIPKEPVSDFTYTWSAGEGTKVNNYSIAQSEINRARIIARTLTLKNASSDFFEFRYNNGTKQTIYLYNTTFDGFLSGDSGKYQIEVIFKSKELGSEVDSYRIINNSSYTVTTYQFSNDIKERINNAHLLPKKVKVSGTHYVLPGSSLKFVLDTSGTFGELVTAELQGEIMPLQDGKSYKLSEWKGKYSFVTSDTKYEAFDISNFAGSLTTEIIVKNLTSSKEITKNVECKLRTDAAGYIYGKVKDSNFTNGNITISGSDTPFTLMDCLSNNYTVQYVNGGNFTHIGGGELHLIVKGTPNTEYTIKVSAT